MDFQKCIQNTLKYKTTEQSERYHITTEPKGK